MNSLWSNIFKNKKTGPPDPKQILGEIPIFNDLTRGDLKEIERIVHVRKYEPGEFVFREGEIGAGLFVIAEGSIDILLDERGEDRAEKRLAALDKGDFFGELSLLDDERRSATAKAAESSVLIGFFRPDLLDLIERNPRLGSKVLMNVARVIGERLRITDARLMGDIPDETAVYKGGSDGKESKDMDKEPNSGA
jgi:CRP-like cAMP-binding protein